jgi:hypothetical protein
MASLQFLTPTVCHVFALRAGKRYPIFLLVEAFLWRESIGQKGRADNLREGLARSFLKLLMQALNKHFSKFLNKKDEVPEYCENKEKKNSF